MGGRGFATRLLGGVVLILTMQLAAWGADARGTGSLLGDRVIGRVVDETKRPIDGAEVSAWADGAQELRDPAMATTRTGPDGRFELVVPFEEVRYCLWARRAGYSSATAIAAAGERGLVEIGLGTRARETLAGSVGEAETGAPVAGATVVLIGESDYRAEVATDAGGKFRIEGVPEGLGQGVIYASKDGRFSAYRLIRSGTDREELALAPAARLRGIVRDRRTGEPLGGCTVTARTPFVSRFSMETVTGEDGRFEFTGLPPGKYGVGATGEGFFEAPTRGDFLEHAELPLNAGECGFHEIRLGREATVKGRVVDVDGRPVAGATVGMRARWGLDYLRQWNTARTDETGAFALTTGRVGRQESVCAFSGRSGYGSAPAANLAEGETREGVVIRLSGTARVRGTVVDASGAPISGVWVRPMWRGESAVTDAGGRFDLGRVTVPGQGTERALTLVAPRPRGAEGPRSPMAAPAPGARFFHHAKVAVDLAPGKDVEVRATLRPAEMATWSGRVLSEAGPPPAGADVILFAGNAGRDWQRELHPAGFMLDSFKVERPAFTLGRTVTDARGRWTIWVVKESPEGLGLVARRPEVDASRFSVGAVASDGRSALVKDVVLKEGETAKQVEMRLDVGEAGPLVSGVVVDTEGRPLGGIEFQLFVPFYPFWNFRSGPDGRFSFHVPRGRDVEGAAPGGPPQPLFIPPRGIRARVRTQGWGVISPDPDPDGRTASLEPEGGAAQEIRIVLGRFGVIRGKARWDTGRPVGAFEARSYTSVMACNPEGAFVLRDCGPGERWVRVRALDGATGGARVAVAPGKEATVEVVLPSATCTIRGRVLEPDGGAGAGAALELLGMNFGRETLPDEKGAFAFRVPPGEFGLSGRATDRGQGAAGFERIVVPVARGEVEKQVTYAKAQPPRAPRRGAPPVVEDFDKQAAALKGALWKRDDPHEAGVTWYATGEGLAAVDARRRTVTRHEKLFGYDKLKATGIAFEPKKVWVGTDKGLMAWDRKVRFWSRVAVGGDWIEAPVEKLSLEGTKLRVTVAAEGGERTHTYDLEASRWTKGP